MCMRRKFNNRLRTLGITASQCAVLDYLFDCEKEEVTQRDIEKGLKSQKSYRDRTAENGWTKRDISYQFQVIRISAARTFT